MSVYIALYIIRLPHPPNHQQANINKHHPTQTVEAGGQARDREALLKLFDLSS